VLLVCTAPALAQRPRPDRPYRGLFGGNGANPNSTQQLDVNLALFGAYDDNVLATTPQGGTDPRFQQSGGFGSGTVSLDYTRRAGRATFDFSGGTGYRYYRSLEEANGFNSFLSVGITARLSPRTDLRLSATGNYTPYYSFTPTAGIRPPAAGDIVPNNPDNPLAQVSTINASSSAALTRNLTSRSSLSADYNFTYTHYSNNNLPYQNWAAGGGYSYRLSPRASFTSAYHYRRGVSGLYQGNQPIDTQDMQFGLTYTKRLSPSRTMSLGFTVGPSVYRSDVPAGTPDAAGQKVTHYPVTASGFVNRQIARSWSLGVNYARGVQYTQGFSDPFFSDYVTVGVNGAISDRSHAMFSAGYNTGNVGVGIAGRGYDTATANASYQFALTRWAALFVNYGYYRYLFDQSVPIPAALSRGQNRNSISAGMNLWAPLLR